MKGWEKFNESSEKNEEFLIATSIHYSILLHSYQNNKPWLKPETDGSCAAEQLLAEELNL